MNSFKAVVMIPFVILGLSLVPVHAQFSKKVELGGYVKEMLRFSLNNDFSELRLDNYLHARIETELKISSRLEFNGDLRSRMLNGYSVRHTPNLGSYYEQDPNLVDLSWVLADRDEVLVHAQIDRLHLSYFNGPLEIYAGRHRVNWGKTYAWNPNDLFNNYAFLDFDYEERPGVDAISAVYNLDFASSLQAGIKAGSQRKDLVVAGMWRTHKDTYDLQFLAGYYREQLTLGAGWAGYIDDAGFKGEISYFNDAENFFNETGFITSTVGFDYMFSNSLYTQAEFLYNGGYDRAGSPLAVLSRPPTADNLFIAKTGFLFSSGYPLNPLVNISTAFMGSFDRSVFIFIPQLSYSLSDNTDLLLLSHLLKGSVFESIETQNLIYLRLKWSF